MFNLNIIDNSQAFLDALPDVMREALSEIGERAVSYAKDDVAVDTGATRDSIDYSVDGNTLTLGANTPQALFVEIGTQRMPARPYLRPALEEHGDEYKDLTEKAMRG